MDEIVSPSLRLGVQVPSTGRIVYVENAPASFKDLDVGTIIKGQVIPSSQSGKVSIQTTQGAIDLITKTPLPPGTDVALEVKSVGARLSVVILSAEVPQNIKAPTEQVQAVVKPPLPAQPTTTFPLVPGRTVVASLTNVPSLTQLHQLPAHLFENITHVTEALVSQLANRNPAGVTQQQTPAGALPQGQNPIPSSLQQTTTPTAPSGPNPTPPVLTRQNQTASPLLAQEIGRGQDRPHIATFSPGDMPRPQQAPLSMTLKVETIMPPTSFVAEGDGPDLSGRPAPTPTQTTLSATVIGQSKTGQMILQSPTGLLHLNETSPLPEGTKVIFSFVDEGLHPTTGQPQQANLLSLSSRWDNLERFIGTLTQTSAAASPQQSPILLQPHEKMPALMAMMMSALKTGDIKQWLGQYSPTLDDEDDEVGKTVEKEFKSLSNLTKEGQTVGEWKTFIMPFYDEETIKQMRLFVRDHPKDSATPDQEEKAGTRFVIELNMSRMGDMQFDGLIRPHHFDLAIRTKKAFPDDMKNDIRRIFDSAQESAQFKGQITFSTTDRFLINPMADILPRHPVST